MAGGLGLGLKLSADRHRLEMKAAVPDMQGDLLEAADRKLEDSGPAPSEARLHLNWARLKVPCLQVEVEAAMACRLEEGALGHGVPEQRKAEAVLEEAYHSVEDKQCCSAN